MVQNSPSAWKNNSLRQLTLAAVVAALYVVLTLPFAAFSYGPLQMRLSETLTVLPAMFPATAPGLWVGCFIANFLNPDNLGPIDIFVGSAVTLIAGLATANIAQPFRREVLERLYQAHIAKTAEERDSALRSRQKGINLNLLLALLPPVLLNALVVGYYVARLTFGGGGESLTYYTLFTMASIFASQAIIIYLVGLPLLLYLVRNRRVLNMLGK